MYICICLYIHKCVYLRFIHHPEPFWLKSFRPMPSYEIKARAGEMKSGAMAVSTVAETVSGAYSTVAETYGPKPKSEDRDQAWDFGSFADIKHFRIREYQPWFFPLRMPFHYNTFCAQFCGRELRGTGIADVVHARKDTPGASDTSDTGPVRPLFKKAGVGKTGRSMAQLP